MELFNESGEDEELGTSSGSYRPHGEPESYPGFGHLSLHHAPLVVTRRMLFDDPSQQLRNTWCNRV